MSLIDRPICDEARLYGGYRLRLDKTSVKRRGIDFRQLCSDVLKDFRFRHVVDAKIHGKKEIPTGIPYRADLVVQLPKQFLHIWTVWQDDAGSNDKWLAFALKIEHLQVPVLIVHGGDGASPKALQWFNDHARHSQHAHGVVSFQEFVDRCLDFALI